jgi:hypothetical protein
VETVDWVIGDALRDMAKIEFGVEIVGPRRDRLEVPSVTR